MTMVEHQHQLDTTGLYCPEPVMMLHSRVAEIESGEVLRVSASDPSTQRDIPKFCQFLGHELIQQLVQGQVFIYYIRKA